jgi:hypothetical protein
VRVAWRRSRWWQIVVAHRVAIRACPRIVEREYLGLSSPEGGVRCLSFVRVNGATFCYRVVPDVEHLGAQDEGCGIACHVGSRLHHHNKVSPDPGCHPSHHGGEGS